MCFPFKYGCTVASTDSVVTNSTTWDALEAYTIDGTGYVHLYRSVDGFFRTSLMVAVCSRDPSSPVLKLQVGQDCIPSKRHYHKWGDKGRESLDHQQSEYDMESP